MWYSQKAKEGHCSRQSLQCLKSNYFVKLSQKGDKYLRGEGTIIGTVDQGNAVFTDLIAGK